MQISWVLAAENPLLLAGFYADLLQIEHHRGLADHHRILRLESGTALEIYRPSSQRSFPDRGRALAPCVRLDPDPQPMVRLEALITEAIRLGGAISEEARLEPFGAEAWLSDPEGNAVLLLVPRKSQAPV